MGTKHKHAEVIKAWADGATIECKSSETADWEIVETPLWAPSYQYRVYREPVVLVGYVRLEAVDINDCGHSYGQEVKIVSGDHNLQVKFVDGKLQSAVVL